MTSPGKLAQKAGSTRKLARYPSKSWVAQGLGSWDMAGPPYKAGGEGGYCPQKAGRKALHPPESWMSQLIAANIS